MVSAGVRGVKRGSGWLGQIHRQRLPAALILYFTLGVIGQ